MCLPALGLVAAAKLPDINQPLRNEQGGMYQWLFGGTSELCQTNIVASVSSM